MTNLFTRKASKIITLYFILCSAPICKAQALSFTTYTIKDGLPSNTITALCQDSKGYIWIGTNNGLCKYDGAEFKIYSTAAGLSNNWITAIVKSPTETNTLWIGTIAGGVNKIKCDSIQHYIYGEDPNWNNVDNLCVDINGNVWYTVYNGLLRIINDSIRIVKDKNAPIHPQKLAALKDGTIWSAEGNKVYIYNPANFLWKISDYNLPKMCEIISLFPDYDSSNKNLIWLGTSNKLILHVDDSKIINKSTTLYGSPFELFDDGQGSILFREHNNFYFLSKKDLVSQNILPLYENENLPSDITPPAMLDNENNLWIGTWTNGVLKNSDLNFMKFQYPSKTDEGNSIAADDNGNIWTGGNRGVWEYHKDPTNMWLKQFHPIYSNYKIKNVYVSMIDRFNRLWLNLDHKEKKVFSIINKKGKSNQLKPVLSGINNILKNKLILTRYIDRKNRLWCSVAKSGIELIDLNTERLIKLYNEKDGMPGKNIKAIFEDSKGSIWIGGWQEGIAILSPNNIMPQCINKLTTSDGLTDNMIRSIFEDTTGTMWIGTRHHGVLVFRNNKIFSISLKNGLLSNSIWDIKSGPNDEIWLGTDVGVERIDRRSLNVIPSNSNFLNGECTAIFNFKNKLWSYLTPEGFIIYNPAKNKRKISPPPVEITNTIVNGSMYSLYKNNELSYNQNNITIEFTGLSFKDEKSTRYQYRLLGADTNWTTPHFQRAVSFASISPGSYTFQVRAINIDGVMSRMPSSIFFIINHPFWLQWWFITLSVLAFSLTLFLFFKYRIKQLMKMEQLRERIASDLHDDVGTNLSSILLTSRLMEKKISMEDEGKEYLHQLSSIAQKTQDTLKETVWLLNPVNDSPPELVLRLKSIASQILSDINFNFESEENVFPEKLPFEVKRNIMLIFKEILQNIIKHSSAKSVKIKLLKDKEIFIMNISDDGKGFDIENIKNGNGLLNLKARAKNISGKLYIDSQTGNGTRIILTLNTTQMRTRNV